MPTPPTDAREFQFTDADFHAVREALYRHTGINLSTARTNLVYSRLSHAAVVRLLPSGELIAEFEGVFAKSGERR